MDSLLCDEVWLSGPSTPATPDYHDEPNQNSNVETYDASFITNREYYQQALCACMEKELSYMPKPGYRDHFQSKNLYFARHRAIQWIIRSCSRLNLSFETVFNAANYLDRFMSSSQCHEWQYWMVHLLTTACLSVASKFIETSAPSLKEIQMEDLDHSFQSITIQQMEIVLLKALGWRLGATTPYTYMELLIMNTDSQSHFRKGLVARVTELLVEAILDSELVEYRPTIVAMSALWCSLEELILSKSDCVLDFAMKFFDHQDQKNDLVECYNTMQSRLLNPFHKLVYCPSSPVTVLLTERNDINYEFHVDISLFKVPGGSNTDIPESSKNKREREETEGMPSEIKMD